MQVAARQGHIFSVKGQGLSLRTIPPLPSLTELRRAGPYECLQR